MKVLSILSVIIFFLIGIDVSAQQTKKERTKEFELINYNGDEVIDKNEMISYYKGKVNKDGERIYGIILFTNYDTDNNELIILEEFLVGSIPDEVKEKEVIIKEKTNINKTVSNTVSPEKTNPNKTVSNTISPKKNQFNDLSVKQKKKIKFQRIDTNDDNVLVLGEMINYYEGEINKKGEPVESKKMFYGLDKNKDGKITFREYLKKIDWKLGKQKLEIIEH